ncbi:threonine dehydratase [Saccharothrix ecbatanensis]|jgi:threonine dehydratase|uniref:Threonine dehydratase n=1 Tax=Saccharothrix ecbatanensis TaxID=1105145 RepID=A0A7W9M312_9PSEU|nr:serine/threonine dehydratase [Saccharothrix ecbatanensis]MBB5805483.1 threonine dehydratase [Saccharothrix ecbatanensis]
MTADVTAAADRIRPYARRTPLWRTEVDGRPIVLKLEHLQLTGSFKLRGALNTLLAAGSPDRVVTASGGNHGLGVAKAAQLLGLHATVYVPVSAPEGKVRRIEAAGAKLIRHGDTYAQAVVAAHEAPGFYVEAYNDPIVVAGQGTVAAEVVADAPDVDVIAVAVGGGGLAAGTALASGLPTIAVEPEHCCALHHALAAGMPVDAEVDSVAASALGATRVGDVPFGILSSHPVTSVLVSDDEILAARDRLWEEFRLAVEPAAAVPFAAWLAGRVPGDLPCVVLCGANTDWTP